MRPPGTPLDYLMDHPECVAVGTGVDEADPEGRPIRSLNIRLVLEEMDRAMSSVHRSNDFTHSGAAG